MRRLSVSVAAALLMGVHVGAGLSAVFAQSTEAAPYQSRYPSEAAAGFAPVADWPGCVPYRNTQQITKLCKESSGTIDTNAFSYLSTRLRAYPKYLASLCELDASVVQAQHDCRGPRIAGTMQWLGDVWKQHQVYERAEQLYAQAYFFWGCPR